MRERLKEVGLAGFGVCAGLLGWQFLGYPLTMGLLARVKGTVDASPEPDIDTMDEPFTTVVVPSYNEAGGRKARSEPPDAVLSERPIRGPVRRLRVDLGFSDVLALSDVIDSRLGNRNDIEGFVDFLPVDTQQLLTLDAGLHECVENRLVILE